MEQPSCSFLTQSKVHGTIFETVVTEAIDDVLSGLGDANKQAIYRHLKNNYGINKNEIPYKIEDFAQAIEQIFGSVATLIEIKIIGRLHAKCKDFSYTLGKEDLNFVEFVYNPRNYLA